MFMDVMYVLVGVNARNKSFRTKLTYHYDIVNDDVEMKDAESFWNKTDRDNNALSRAVLPRCDLPLHSITCKATVVFN
jgi:hypothetical protein